MTVYGNVTGPIYPLGKLTVVTSGTVVPLSTNVATTTGFGTPAAGVAGLTSKGQLAPMCCNRIRVTAPAANTGANIYLVFKSGGGFAAAPQSVIMVIPKGQTQEIYSPNINSPFQVDQMALDADTAADVAWVTLLIL